MAVVPRVEVNGVSHSYGETRALDGVSLFLSDAEILGLVGPDGAGKSTLIRLMVPVMRAVTGSIRIAGNDAIARPESIRDLVGYMPQRFALYEDLSVDENIRFFAELHRVPRSEYEPRRADLLRFTRLAPFSGRRAGKLSGGMKQKLGLICTLIHRPAVLLLDEPTNGVDPVSRREFWEILRAIVAGGADTAGSADSARPSVIVSTPYMDEAERCDRVALMDGGRIRATGKPEDLRARVAGEVLEIALPDPIRARELVAAASGEREVAVFGGTLRVRTRRKGAVDAIRTSLEKAGIAADVSHVPPSMEDVFLALSAEAEGNASA